MKVNFTRMLIFVLSGLALASFTLVSRVANSTETNHTFNGQYTSADWGTYRYIPFDVPPGIATIKVTYSYSTDDGAPAVLDIGLHDPEKFRGWSGATRNEFTVSESRDQTSDAYIPGEVPAGEWRIELGIPSIDPMTALAYRLYGEKAPKRSSTVTYQVDVTLSDQPVGEPYVAPAKQDVVINTAPGWYYGDLHCHSTHSDGAYPLADVYKFAHGYGLDFIATAEHNAISHYAFIGEMQQNYPDMLILYGSELTTYIGHANVYNYTEMYDYRATAPGYDINQVIDEIHAGGGYFSPNHPASVLGAGIPYLVPNTDWSRIDFYEVVNGKTRVFNFIPNPINTKALRLWNRMLRDGHRPTAVGGSDDHYAGQKETPVSSHVGIPTTVVYAEALSTRAILDGLAAGHVYILNQGKESGQAIEFTASGAGQSVMMGDRIEADAIDFQVKVENSAWRTLKIVENGMPLYIPITSDHFDYHFKRQPKRPGFVRLEVKSGPFSEIITNPIYYRPSTD